MPNQNRSPKKSSTTPTTPPTPTIPTICISVNEQNNNSLTKCDPYTTNGKAGILNCLPEIFTDIDLNGNGGISANYLKNGTYKPYIFGKPKSIDFVSEDDSIDSLRFRFLSNFFSLFFCWSIILFLLSVVSSSLTQRGSDTT